MYPCVFCDMLTRDRCPECKDPYHHTHETVLCPMCVKIKRFKAEQAERRRAVYCQYTVEVPLHIRVPGQQSLGEVTEPMPTLKVESL